MNQKDIYRSANLVNDKYGADAAAHAGRRIQEMIGRRDVLRAGVWRRSQRTVRHLQGTNGGTKH
jgi:hypothetical protein